ncbi:hypothetical protein [Pricia sp.]|uniref:hypothetical protein n=1 Tax=Pricia sp. TaxID=2268138 RepID=UPI0035945F82
MKRTLFILFGLWTYIAAGQSIPSGEYFFDTEPGVGRGTSIALNGNTGQLTQSLAIPTTGLSDGFHNFYIRTLDSNGIWSLYDRTVIFITSFNNTSGPIIAAEYYFDTDPGSGSGIALAVDDNTGLLSQSYVIPTMGLSVGAHTFFIRVQDESGEWSLADSATIQVSGDAIDNSVTLDGTTLTANYNASGAAYHWIDCDNGIPIAEETNRSFEVLESGNYSVEITQGAQTVVSECIAVTVTIDPDDTDGDGVPNGLDACPQTPKNTAVDVAGCEVFSLATSNFRIRSTGESCVNSANGSIQIDAEKLLDYSATLTDTNGATVNTFTSDTRFENLVAGKYSLCITVAGQAGYESCQEVVITQPEALTVTSKIHASKGKVTLSLKGGKTYTVHLNEEVYTTSENEITLPLSAARTTYR